jgi:hypothetical protein
VVLGSCACTVEENAGLIENENDQVMVLLWWIEVAWLTPEPRESPCRWISPQRVDSLR